MKIGRYDYNDHESIKEELKEFRRMKRSIKNDENIEFI